MKTEGWLSLRILWLAVLLIATACALILVGWEFAEWRAQHAENEMRSEFFTPSRGTRLYRKSFPSGGIVIQFRRQSAASLCENQ